MYTSLAMHVTYWCKTLTHQKRSWPWAKPISRFRLAGRSRLMSWQDLLKNRNVSIYEINSLITTGNWLKSPARREKSNKQTTHSVRITATRDYMVDSELETFTQGNS